MNKKICVSSLLEGAPGEIQVIPFGRHSTAKGEFVLDAEGVKAILSAFEAKKNQMVIDYEHQTLTGDIAPAAGWITRLMDRGRDGLWADVEWTPRAEKYLGGCEYRYLSPVFLKDAESGRVMRLLNAGLTNQPAIDGMAPIEKGPQAPEQEGSLAPGKKEKEEIVMLKELAELLALKDVGDREGVLKAVGNMRDELAAMKEVLESVRGAMGLDADATAAELEGTVEAMKQAGEGARGLMDRLREAEEKLLHREAGELVALAMKEGKVTPAQKEWAMEYAMRDAESFRVFAAKAPVMVPVGQVGVREAKKEGPGPCVLQVEVNRALGLSDERFIKFSNKEVR